MTASGGAPLVVSDAAADARVAGLPPVASGAVSAYLGVPLRTAEDITVGALCVFDSAPRTWSAYDVALLEELGGSVMAELELAALAVEYETSRVRWDTALRLPALAVSTGTCARTSSSGTSGCRRCSATPPGSTSRG